MRLPVILLVSLYLEMASPTFSLTDILIRGRQTNSQVIVSGVPSRREKKIGTPDRRLAKYETQKPSTCRATLFRCKFLSMFPVFSPCVINLSRNKNICCGLKKVFAKSRTRIYFEPQLLALLLVFSSSATNLLVPYKSTNQRAAFLQLATNVFVADQVDQAR